MYSVNDQTKPPSGNTGAQNTKEVSLDWIGCTFLDGDDLETIAKELDISITDSTKWGYGTMGYTDVWGCFGGWIGINPDRPDMGIHIELTGRALDQLRIHTAKTDYQIINWLTALGAKFTRIDVALDIFSPDDLTLDQLNDAIKGGLCVSRWKTAKQYATYKLIDGQSLGGADLGGFTFGSRSSRSYLRIYDKEQEQRAKGKDTDKKHWIRIEMEYKDKNARAASDQINDTQGLSWFGSNLRYYLDIKAPGQKGKNRSRWDTAQFWLDLTSDIKERLPIAKKIAQDIVIAAKRWIQRQVTPTIAFLLKVNGGDIDIIREMIQDGLPRMPKRYIRVLAEITGEC